MSNAITIQPPETTELQTSGNDMATQARSIVVSNVDEHRDALHFVQDVVALKRSINERFDPVKKAAHSAHKAVCAMERELTDPLDAARSLVTRKVADYEVAERRRAEEEARARALVGVGDRAATRQAPAAGQRDRAIDAARARGRSSPRGSSATARRRIVRRSRQ